MKVKLKSSDEVQTVLKDKGEISGLEYDKIYTVMGYIRKNDTDLFYLDIGTFYPILYKMCFFDIVENKISKNWVFSVKDDLLSLTFQDWINIPNFLNYYVNGDIDEDPNFYNLREFVFYQDLLK